MVETEETFVAGWRRCGCVVAATEDNDESRSYKFVFLVSSGREDPAILGANSSALPHGVHAIFALKKPSRSIEYEKVSAFFPLRSRQ